MKYVDIAVTMVYVLALVAIYFFWGCTWDIYVTILAGLVVIVSVYIGILQNKKLKQLEEGQE